MRDKIESEPGSAYLLGNRHMQIVNTWLYLHGEYKDQQAITDRLMNVTNRQVEAMATSYTELLNQQSIRQMNEIVKLSHCWDITVENLDS